MGEGLFITVTYKTKLKLDREVGGEGFSELWFFNRYVNRYFKTYFKKYFEVFQEAFQEIFHDVFQEIV